MIVESLEVGERTTLHENETTVELYTKIGGPTGEEVELVWLIPDDFSTEKAAHLAYLFNEIRDLVGLEPESN
jgi:hypothetical protein